MTRQTKLHQKPKKQREKLFWSRRAEKKIKAADDVWVKDLEAKRKAARDALQTRNGSHLTPD